MDDDRDRDLTVHQRYSGKMGDNKDQDLTW